MPAESVDMQLFNKKQSQLEKTCKRTFKLWENPYFSYILFPDAYVCCKIEETICKEEVVPWTFGGRLTNIFFCF
ncbi:hypothetical protein CR205_10870 [Alteribacter lacisalsi]|uniref:Uncharacterized protein n=1 Tax=Alteribacter lacisalsi TaxID=2045244 RepID=A0A2W0HAZ9_9BACI|nr:hypothetical protein CR205_10870 [Alteribacter lacisalsi]